MNCTRRALKAVLLLALAAIVQLPLTAQASAQKAADIAKLASLPIMALGAANAPVTIVEFAAPTCPHCAQFNRDVFPRIRSKYIDTGKIRYVFREFPLNIKDAGCEMLARHIADNDAAKYFAVLDLMFRQQDALLEQTTETLKLIGKQAGLSGQAVEDCLSDDALLAKIKTDRKFASEVLNVTGTPTFFINGERIVGAISSEEFEMRINRLLKS